MRREGCKYEARTIIMRQARVVMYLGQVHSSRDVFGPSAHRRLSFNMSESAAGQKSLVVYHKICVLQWGHWQSCGPRIAASGSIPGAP
jgi:hypothetical protein